MFIHFTKKLQYDYQYIRPRVCMRLSVHLTKDMYAIISTSDQGYVGDYQYISPRKYKQCSIHLTKVFIDNFKCVWPMTFMAIVNTSDRRYLGWLPYQENWFITIIMMGSRTRIVNHGILKRTVDRFKNTLYLDVHSLDIACNNVNTFNYVI